jgi:hypothetical protein
MIELMSKNDLDHIFNFFQVLTPLLQDKFFINNICQKLNYQQHSDVLPFYIFFT